jgi:hypothetical protein
MKLTTITIFFSLVSIVLILKTLENIKREVVGIRSGLVWILVWVGIGFFSLFPGLLDSAMRLAQMESRMFFILLLAVFILFALVFNLASKMDRTRRDMAKLIRELSLLHHRLESEKEHGDPPPRPETDR